MITSLLMISEFSVPFETGLLSFCLQQVKNYASLINLNVACCFNLASKLIFWTHNDRLYNIYKICVILDRPSLAFANAMNDFTHRHFKVINGGFWQDKKCCDRSKTETVRSLVKSNVAIKWKSKLILLLIVAVHSI